MTKELMIQEIISALSADLTVFSSAARAAHEAATHAECLPDNKYDTTALEASYIAQGQANRAQEIRAAIEPGAAIPPPIWRQAKAVPPIAGACRRVT